MKFFSVGIKLVATVLFVLVLFTAALAVALSSSTGSKFIVNNLSRILAPEIVIEDFEGRLVDRFSIGAVEILNEENSAFVRDLTIDWSPAQLLKRRVQINEIFASQVRIASAGATEKDSPPELKLPSLPVEISIRQLLVESIALSLNENEHQFGPINFQLDWLQRGISVDQLSLVYDEHAINLSADINNEIPLSLTGQINWEGIVNSLNSTASLTFSGPLSEFVFGLDTDGIVELHATGNINLEDSTLPLSVNLEHQAKVLSPSSAFEIGDGTLDLKGNIYQFQFNYSTTAESNSFEQAKIAIGGGVSAREGDFNNIAAKLNWELGHPNLIGSKLNGSTNLNFASPILNIESKSLSPYPTNLTAKVNPFDLNDASAVSLSWHDINVPNVGIAELLAERGRVNFDGTLRDGDIIVESLWSHPQYGAAEINFGGVLQNDSLHITNGIAKLLAGVVKYSGVVDWQDIPAADLKIGGKRLNLSKVRADLDTLVDFQLSALLKAPESGLQTKIELQQASGIWRDQKLSGSGLISTENNEIRADDFRVAIGPNQASVDLQLSDKIAGSYQITAPDLSLILDELSGTISGAGHISGTRQQPIVAGDLHINGLIFEQWRLQSLELSYDVHPFSTRNSKIASELNGLSKLGDNALSVNASLTAEGNIDDHSAKLRISSNLVDLAAQIDGSWRDDLWNASLRTLSLSEENIGDWSLRREASLSVSKAGDFHLASPICISQSTADFCLNEAKRLGKNVLTRGIIKSLPLALLNHWLPSDLKIRGEINADFDADIKENNFLGSVQYNVANGLITLSPSEAKAEEISINEFSGRVTSNGIKADVTAITQIDDWVDLKVTGDIPADPKSTLLVNIAGRSAEISWLSEFIPELSGSSGAFKFDGQITGNRENPAVQLSAGLQSGVISVLPGGLKFSALDLSIQNSQPNVLEIDLLAKPQKGEIKIQGTAERDADGLWPFKINLSGDNFSAARLPEIEIDLTPALHISGNRKAMEVTGSVQIPYFSYTINEIPKSAVRVSDDAVIVGDDAANNVLEKDTPNWFKESLSLDVAVRLGNDVTMSGLGMFARLAGDLQVTKSINDELKGSGTILVASGQFDAYGHALSINDGRLMFAGPLTNPNLNIRAVRDNIPVTAGVAITGTARAPKFSVFSDPAMSDSEVLSYVVTGRALNEGTSADAALISQAALGFGLEQSAMITSQLRDLFALDELGLSGGNDINQTALVAGKQITPKVSVRTEMNIFDQLWSFYLQYKLTDQWSIEAESGERQGADVIYNYEAESLKEFIPSW